MPPPLRDRAFTAGIEAGATVLHAAERAVLRTSTVPTTPFLATDGFGWIAELERSWKEIRVELDEVQCGITVGGESATWEEGRSLLFDDGYDHHAWNDSDEVRVVLFVDVLRPLRAPADRVNRTLVQAIGRSPYITDARNRHQAWERRFDRVRGGT